MLGRLEQNCRGRQKYDVDWGRSINVDQIGRSRLGQACRGRQKCRLLKDCRPPLCAKTLINIDLHTK